MSLQNRRGYGDRRTAQAILRGRSSDTPSRTSGPCTFARSALVLPATWARPRPARQPSAACSKDKRRHQVLPWLPFWARRPSGRDLAVGHDRALLTYCRSRWSNSKRAELEAGAGREIRPAEGRTCSGSRRPDSTAATVAATRSAVRSRSGRCSPWPSPADRAGTRVGSQRTSPAASPHGVAPRRGVR